MSRIFCYSDPHFGHVNIFKYEPDRPFTDIKDVNNPRLKS
jgi:calcineurin-like phosphoesterase family protein